VKAPLKRQKISANFTVFVDVQEFAESTESERSDRYPCQNREITMKPFPFVIELCLSLVVTASAQAQTAAPAADSPVQKMSRYDSTHGGTPGVFRRDPNIWVMTPEVAERSGMPKAWASSELRGVAAAAFRREPEGAEADCGFGGNKNACQPVINCVLELYFDRNTHLLPWREGSPVADFDNRRGSSNYHQNFGGGRDPVTGALSRRNQLRLVEPFIDPVSGQELFWKAVGGAYNTGWLQMMAYDREIHGSFSYVKLDHGCGGHPYANGQTLQLVSKDERLKVLKVLYEVFLPNAWSARAGAVVKESTQQNENFYKDVFQGMQPSGANK
jgi:hypothetical protein